MLNLVYLALIWTLIYAVASVLAEVPPKQPPAEMLAGYTMNNSIPIDFFYVDDTFKGEATHFIYTEPEIEQYITSAQKVIARFQHIQSKILNIPLQVSIPLTAASAVIQQLPKQQWIQFALYSCQKPYIQGKKVGVIGSMEPWIEAFLLALGASTVVTIEYNTLTYTHPQIQTINKSQFDVLYAKCKAAAEVQHSSNNDENADSSGKNTTNNSNESCHYQSFDFIISPSAFDHDGLGRYGDPLSPDADIAAMQRMQLLLKPNHQGVLLLTVPIGPDITVFNLHRRYGTRRLPLLLQGWQEIARLGWDQAKVNDETADWRKTYEPVFLLSFDHITTTTEEDAQSSRSNTIISSNEDEGYRSNDDL